MYEQTTTPEKTRTRLYLARIRKEDCKDNEEHQKRGSDCGITHPKGLVEIRRICAEELK